MPTEQPAVANFKTVIVWLILNKQTEKALELLSKDYGVVVPKLKVGLPKGHTRNAYGTYNAQKQTICVLDSEVFGNPFVILHEFYHHLRSKGADKLHRGTEKNADKFAVEFLREYQAAAANAAPKKDN
jgi:Zn-dependent peptidase ImmA (M78 family)